MQSFYSDEAVAFLSSCLSSHILPTVSPSFQKATKSDQTFKNVFFTQKVLDGDEDYASHQSLECEECLSSNLLNHTNRWRWFSTLLS